MHMIAGRFILGLQLSGHLLMNCTNTGYMLLSQGGCLLYNESFYWLSFHGNACLLLRPQLDFSRAFQDSLVKLPSASRVHIMDNIIEKLAKGKRPPAKLLMSNHASEHMKHLIKVQQVRIATDVSYRCL